MKLALMTPPLEAHPCLWLLETDTAEIGVHLEKGWYGVLREEMILFNTKNKCLFLLRALEIEPEKFLEFLKTSAQSYPLYAKSIDSFPFELLFKNTFCNSSSAYWSEKAFNWLLLQENIQHLFEDELQSIIKNKGMPQKLRQMSQKMLRHVMKNTAHESSFGKAP